MELIQWLTLAVFAVTILTVVINKLDSTAAALVGVVVMVWMGAMTETEAFLLVDWNVMAILVSIWMIAGYFGKSGVPSWLSVQALKLSGGRPGLLVMILSMLAGVISMFVDNVVTILMMAPVALPLARALKIPVTPLVLMIGLSANFMGTALLLGDLPPQMLHSVSGAEFGDFIWQHGRPSSFIILMVTFVITLAFMYVYGFRGAGSRKSVAEAGIEAKIPDPLFATIAVGMFLVTVFGMAMREYLDVKLGFIAMTGAIALVLIVEAMGERLQAPSFEDILQGLDFRAIFFYIALFALVGGLEKAHILELFAESLKPLFAHNYALGATILYWVTIPIVGLVEHGAYILTFLYPIRDLGGAGVPTWPLWWMVLWSGTLGSNLT
ncbi:MAG: anion permease, partial [Rhodospirillales bacterium]|nr:anion permease [Rhodospirillales bacterium]